MKFSVFGSNGFIGSSMVDFLKKQKIDYEELDPNDQQIFEKELGHVVYCIGITSDFRERPFDTVEAHVCLLHKILKNCKFDSFLYLSSTRVYSNSSSTKEDTQLSVNPNKFEEIYNISKIMGESICLASINPNVRIVRLSNVIGNNRNTNDFLSSLIYDAVNNNKIILHTTSESEKDYVHIDDVVKILPKISLKGKQKIYNIAGGKNTKVKEIINQLIKMTDCEVVFTSDAKKNSFSEIDIKRIQEEFSFKPTFVLEELGKIIAACHNKTK